MTRCDAVEDHLSLYIDGLLDPRAEAAVRAHLANCPTCHAVVADLRLVTAAARQLGPLAPPQHVWNQIADELLIAETAAARGGWIRPSWAWLGLAASLVGATVLASWVVRAGPTGRTDEMSSTPASIRTVATELDLAAHSYEQTIAELEGFALHDVDADPVLASALRQNMQVLDRAITESRRVLIVDPTNEPARTSLFEALRRKVDLLQTTTLLIDEAAGADDAGARETAEGTGREL